MKRSEVLDRTIHEAAYREFYEKGFQGASMRGIAYDAGVTVGALYTRYSTKEQMFLACVSDLLKAVEENLERVRQIYLDAPTDGSLESVRNMFIQETELMTEAVLSNYDQAVLLLHRGQGSGVEDMFDKVIGYKVEGLERYLRRSGKDADPELLRYIVDMQIRSGIAVISPKHDVETARACMELNYKYHTAGWEFVAGEVLRDIS